MMHERHELLYSVHQAVASPSFVARRRSLAPFEVHMLTQTRAATRTNISLQSSGAGWSFLVVACCVVAALYELLRYGLVLSTVCGISCCACVTCNSVRMIMIMIVDDRSGQIIDQASGPGPHLAAER